MENDIYFKDRNNNEYTKYTKEEIRDKVDPFRPETFIPFLKDMNYPYFENEWGNILSKSYKSIGGTKTVIGKYISKMRLCSYKNFTFKDSQYHKELQEFSLKAYGLYFDEERRLVTVIDNEDLLPIWNYKENKLEYKELRDEIHKILFDFFLREMRYNKDKKFDFEFMEFRIDEILRLIRRQGGTV